MTTNPGRYSQQQLNGPIKPTTLPSLQNHNISSSYLKSKQYQSKNQGQTNAATQQMLYQQNQHQVRRSQNLVIRKPNNGNLEGYQRQSIGDMRRSVDFGMGPMKMTFNINFSRDYEDEIQGKTRNYSQNTSPKSNKHQYATLDQGNHQRHGSLPRLDQVRENDYHQESPEENYNHYTQPRGQLTQVQGKAPRLQNPNNINVQVPNLIQQSSGQISNKQNERLQIKEAELKRRESDLTRREVEVIAKEQRLMKLEQELNAHHQNKLNLPSVAVKNISKQKTLKEEKKDEQNKKEMPSLGILRLDYDYPAAPGDMDCPDSFDYDVYYRAIPGYTFSMCQEDKITPKVDKAMHKAVRWLIDEKNVSGISGDCGFMMYIQEEIRAMTSIPVFMSALAQMPSICTALSPESSIIIMTANGKTLKPMQDLIASECGFHTEEERFICVGCEDVPGFEAVAVGGKVDTVKVEPGVVALVNQTLKQHPKAACILMECTELPPYSDAVRNATGLPVFDAITNCDFFINAFRDNERFGKNDWQHDWDGVQDVYKFGHELDDSDRKHLENDLAKHSSRRTGRK